MSNGGRVAVTGGIGSGKSEAIKIIKEYGYEVFSCDEIYKELSNEKEYLTQLKKLFPSVVNENGLDRRTLSNIVFNNTDELKKLNEFSHPKIMGRLLDKLQNFKGWRFAEVPLLFEEGYENNFDYVIVIYRDLEKRIAAVSLRDKLSLDEITARISNQFDYDKFLKSGNFKENIFIVKNNDGVEDLKKSIHLILSKLSDR